MSVTKRQLRRAATLAHQMLALGSLLALMILVPTKDPQSGLGAQFRDLSRVPVKIHVGVPADLQLASAQLPLSATR
jgi:hypothetical protein